MRNDPNFPKELGISPYIKLVHNRHHHNDHVDDDVFGITAQQHSIEKYGIAGRIWEAAYALITYLNHDTTWDFDPVFIDGPSSLQRHVIIELGSGTGIVSARIADSDVLKDRDIVIVTDLPSVCPLLENNLRSQMKEPSSVSLDGGIVVQPLTWGNLDDALNIARYLELSTTCEPCCLTHIICSDLIYFPELHGPLLRTLIHLTSMPFVNYSKAHPAEIVISYKIRSFLKETPFWTAFGLWFSFQPVVARQKMAQGWSDWDRFNPSDDGDRIFVFVAHRRPESYKWEVPLEDRDLMNGVGAKNSSSNKGDDTFETLLFMDLAFSEENTIC
ncbi:putative methyltransferase-domain-containing protein [Hygrophoropsis aurantiaca]|uniref:Methyltransferase-domain-containing protein n=1 Tax=Hygrophoropsis aurantiaca TaxID=72124 RepID=A0ACB8AHN5_9AGAM|nr:putative methyltransferase-domain-containing protein [Hygrophoropsis aurantiaca]